MKNWELHECEFLPKAGIQVVFDSGYFERDKNSWRLEIRREATEQDLEENNYLEEVGQEIWETIIEIKHCPYCGIDLYGEANAPVAEIGKFVHIDSSGWSSKYL